MEIEVCSLYISAKKDRPSHPDPHLKQIAAREMH